jgi:hypothetical protein
MAPWFVGIDGCLRRSVQESVCNAGLADYSGFR